MTLKRQLFLLGLLALVLPWLAANYVKRMDSALRQMRLASVEEIASNAALSLASNASLVNALIQRNQETPAQFAEQLTDDHVLDGYISEWPHFKGNCSGAGCGNTTYWSEFLNMPRGSKVHVSFTVQGDNSSVWLALSIENIKPVYYSPQAQLFDSLTLRFKGDKAIRLISAAPGMGMVEQWQAELWHRSYDAAGYWQVLSNGATIEWQLPKWFKNQEFSLEFFSAALGYSVFITAENTPLYLAFIDSNFNSIANTLAAKQQKVSLFDMRGFPVTTAGELSLGQGLPQIRARDSWLMRIYFALINRPEIEYQNPKIPLRVEKSHWLFNRISPVARTLVPIKLSSGDQVGWLMLDRQETEFDALLAEIYGQFVLVCFVFAFLVVAILLGFASVHSWRIRRLAAESERAIDVLGNLQGSFKSSRMPDEIGQLSRSFATLIYRLAGHQEYLKNLAGKLSHELRTPIAIVQTSLENLQTETTDKKSVYLQRAQQGLGRLSSTLNKMSSVNALEQSLAQSECETFCLKTVLSDLASAYSATYAKKIQLIVGDDSSDINWSVNAAPDLIVQMLDKLVENASQFAAANTAITLVAKANKAMRFEPKRHCVDAKGWVVLTVCNTGAALPAEFEHQLFDSMVSVRESVNDQEIHLGLGLYIARLICEFHGGSIHASSIPAAEGAGFDIKFDICLPILMSGKRKKP